MKIVLPGDMIAEKQLSSANVMLEGGKTYATVMGLFDEEKGMFIPLESVWYPAMDDLVVGTVESEKNGVSFVDLNSPFKGLLILKHSPLHLNSGDVIEAYVQLTKKEGDRIMVVLARPRKLFGGMLVYVNSAKVPRIIGKQSTMVNQIIDKTGCKIEVGRNGVIWLKEGDTQLAIRAIEKIQEEAHVSGLTEQILKLLGSK